MWRIYSPDGDGVKVKTTARKLFNVLVSSPHQYAALRYFIGKVEYWHQPRLVAYFNNPRIAKGYLTDSTARGPAQALLVKRREFIHEKEVRLIFQCAQSEGRANTKCFPMDPNSLYEEMELDPRIDDPMMIIAWTTEFRNLGYTNNIQQSEFYRLPSLSPIPLD